MAMFSFLEYPEPSAQKRGGRSSKPKRKRRPEDDVLAALFLFDVRLYGVDNLVGYLID